MRKLFITVSLLLSSSLFSGDVEGLFDSKCLVCHLKQKPVDKSKVVAPAITGVMRHIKMQFPRKDEAVEFIVDYVLEPSKKKAICMPKKIKRFGLMPSQKENITKVELREVANWVYDNFPNRKMLQNKKQKCEVTPK